ncbi:MAG TPA: hypothetical protein VD913_01860, partial [bacterium]|nr:hypothetical protein [bacterium]
LNPALRHALRLFTSYDSSQKELKTLLQFLKKQARRHLEIDLEDAFYQPKWPMLVRYFRMERIEPTDKDMQMLEKEKPTFLSYLGTIQLSPEVLSQIREILDVNTRDTERTVSGMSVRAVFERMMVSLPEDFDFAAYENVRLYIQYLILQEELDVAMFNRETDQLKRELLDKLARTAAEKRMVSYYEEVKILRKTLNLELTREEYERILKREKGWADQSLRPSYLMNQLGAIGGKAIQKELERVELGSIDVLYDQAFGFYKGAIERERFMEEEMASVMKAKRARQVVLVTGGFHSKGMKDYLISRGLSYVRLSPHISEIHEDKAYRRAMLETSQISNILKLQRSEIRQSLAGHAAYERYYAKLIDEARHDLALTKTVPRSEVRHTFDEYELRKFLLEISKRKPLTQVEDLIPLKIRLKGQFRTDKNSKALAEWVIKNREGFLWDRMAQKLGGQPPVKNRQELLVFIPYPGGFMPSQIDRGKFMALFFFIANTYIDYFVPLVPAPEDRPDQPYGFLLTDEKGNLGYSVDLSPDISEKNLAIMLRHIQLFNAAMLLANAEEASLRSKTGSVPDIMDRQMRMAAQAYRNFEKQFVQFLREYNQYRDPKNLYELKHGDLAGRLERHKAREDALKRYRLEEVLHPYYPWLVPVAESARNRNKMLPLFYGIEGAMLNTELIETEQVSGNKEEVIQFRGKEFIEWTRKLGYEAAELISTIFAGKAAVPLMKKIPSDLFIDIENNKEVSLDYLQKVTNALAQGRMTRSRLPDPQTFDGAVNYYKIKPDVQPLTSAEPAKAIPETESPDVEEKAKDPVTLRRVEEIRNAVRQNPANATAYDFRLLLETLKDPNREVREAVLTALPYFLAEKPSLRSLMLPYRRQIEKALGEHFGIIKALKDRPDEASLADLMDVGILTSNKRIDPTRDIDSLAQSLIDRPGRPPVDTLLVSVPFDTGRLPSQIDRAKFIALFLFVSSTDLDHFRPLNPAPERSRRADTFFGRIDQRIEDFIEFLEDLVFGTIYDFLVKIKIIKEPVIPQGILHRPDTDKGEERGLMYRFHLSENTDLPREAEEMNLKRYLRMVQVLDLGLFLASAEESYQVFFPGEVPAWMRSQRLRALAQVYRAFEQRIVWLLREYDAYLDPQRIPDTDKKDLQKYRQAMKEAFGKYRLSEILYASHSWQAKDWKKLIN